MMRKQISLLQLTQFLRCPVQGHENHQISSLKIKGENLGGNCTAACYFDPQCQIQLVQLDDLINNYLLQQGQCYNTPTAQDQIRADLDLLITNIEALKQQLLNKCNQLQKRIASKLDLNLKKTDDPILKLVQKYQSQQVTQTLISEMAVEFSNYIIKGEDNQWTLTRPDFVVEQTTRMRGQSRILKKMSEQCEEKNILFQFINPEILKSWETNVDPELFNFILQLQQKEGAVSTSQDFDLKSQILKMQKDKSILAAINKSKQQQLLKYKKQSVQETQVRNLVEMLQQLERQDINRVNMSQSSNQKLVNYLVKKFSNNKFIKELLRLFVLLTSFQNSLILCGSNSAHLLTKMGYHLNDLNLKGIRLEDTDLSGAQFVNTVLDQSKFDKVNITNCNFSKASLKAIQWTQLTLSEQQLLHFDNGRSMPSKIALLNQTGSPGSDQVQKSLLVVSSGDRIYGQLTQGSDPRIKLIDLKNACVIEYLEGHEGAVLSVSISPQGNQIASCGEDKTIRLWDAKSRCQTQKLLGHSDKVISVVYSNDGEKIASSSLDQTIMLWSCSTGELLKKIDNQSVSYSISFSPNQQKLAYCADELTLRIYDISGEDQHDILLGNKGKIFSLAYSQNGAQIALGGEDKMLTLCDVSQCTKVHKFIGHKGAIYAIYFIPGDSIVASGGEDPAIFLWNAADGTCLAKLDGHRNQVMSLAYDSLSRTLISASWDGYIGRWDVTSKMQSRAFDGHEDKITAVAYTADLKFTASGSLDRTVRIWDTLSGNHLYTLCEHSGRITALSFSPDNKILASGGSDARLLLWATENGKRIRKLEGHHGEITCVTIVADSNRLASSANDQSIIVWDIDLGLQVRKFEVKKGRVSCVAFSSNGKLLASAHSQENFVTIWDVDQGIQPLKVDINQSASIVVFSSNGSTLAAGSIENIVYQWNTKTFKRIKKDSFKTTTEMYTQLYEFNQEEFLSSTSAKCKLILEQVNITKRFTIRKIKSLQASDAILEDCKIQSSLGFDLTDLFQNFAQKQS